MMIAVAVVGGRPGKGWVAQKTFRSWGPLLFRRALLVCLAGALTACGPASAFGLSGDDTSVQVLVRRCPDERVKEVSVQRVDSQEGGQVRGPVLWRITSHDGVAVDAITVGQTPDGFVTAVPLAGNLPAGADLVAYVTTSYAGGNMGFRLSDLRRDRVYSYRESLSVHAFESTSRSC